MFKNLCETTCRMQVPFVLSSPVSFRAKTELILENSNNIFEKYSQMNLNSIYFKPTFEISKLYAILTVAWRLEISVYKKIFNSHLIFSLLNI